MICAQQVFRCFRAVERLGDKLTGAAGPLFVTLGVILLSVGATCFCTSHFLYDGHVLNYVILS